MRRLPSSWDRTRTSLGLRLNKSRSLKRIVSANSVVLRGERLEDRRVLAAWFERTDDLDQWATAHPNVAIDLEMVASADFDSDELLAFSGAIAQIDRDAGFAQEELALLGRANVRRDDEVFIPTVQAASQQALLLNIVEPVHGRAGVYGGTAVGNGVFELFEDDPVVNEFTFHGTLFLAAYGDDQTSGDVQAQQSMFVRASIGEFFVESTPNGDGTWNFTTNLPGYSDDPAAGAPNGAFVFTIDNLTQGALLSFESQVNSWNVLENNTNGTGFGQSQWELVAAAWGSVTPEAQAPLNGDFDGDGDVDADDLSIWAQNSGAGPGGDNGPNFGTLSQGDADEDGDVDEDDLGIWADAAANSPTGKIFLVSSEGDSVDADRTYGNLTLREALAMSDASAGDDDVIMFGPGVDLITIGSALSIADEVSIVGPGADKLTVSGNNSTRVFTVSNGISASISGLTVADGDTTGSGGGLYVSGDLDLIDVDVVSNDADFYGGGAYVDANGTLTIQGSTFDDNEAGAGGGAISGVFKSGTALDITSSTFSNNVGYAAGGGAILYYSNVGATTNLNIEGSTFSGNTANSSGAIQFQNAVGTTITASIVNSTIANNTATSLSGGGIVNLNGSTITLHNTILANNTASNTTFHDVWGSVAGGGASSYNLIGQVGGSGLTHNSNGNKVGTTGTRIDALLAPLGNYGGRTQTHPLKTSSPAIDAGKGSLSNLEDQRGYTREVDLSTTNGSDGYRDIGAYEAGEGTTLIVRSDGDRNNSVSDKATTDSLRLREAIALAAALAGTETITFDQSSWGDNEIQLSSTWGQLSVGDGVSIEGPGADALTVAAAPSSRVFELDNNVTLKGMRVTGGNVTGNGGGVYIDGDATLDGVQVDHNAASGQGGGIYTSGNMELTLKNSTLWSNDAGGQGGGLYVGGFVDATVLNSTFSDNESGSQGGGIYRASFATMRVVNATVAFNRAATGGGGIHSASTSTRLDNTIVSNNTSTSGGPDISGTFNSSSTRNLIGVDATTGNGIDNGDANGNVVSANARLKALANYGGAILTHTLYSDSDAIDNGDNGVAVLFGLDEDQRGFARTADFNDDDLTEYVDIGAVELAFDGLYL